MNEKETAIWELIDKMEQQLNQFQDKMEISQIWQLFLDDIKSRKIVVPQILEVDGSEGVDPQSVVKAK